MPKRVASLERLAKCRERVKRWKKANPDKVKLYNARVYERRSVAYLDSRRFGKVDVRLIDNYYTRICGICEQFIESKFDVDHIIPLSRGGTNQLDNLQLAHPICNATKKDRLQHELGSDLPILKGYNFSGVIL